MKNQLVPTLIFILAIFFLEKFYLFAAADGDKKQNLFSVGNAEPQNLFPISEKELESFEVEEVIPRKTHADKYSRTVVTPENLAFRTAPDMPIEKYAAYEGPIGFDSYVYRKFKQQEEIINARFNQIDQRIAGLENMISEIKTLISRPQVLMPQEPMTQVVKTPPPERESKLV